MNWAVKKALRADTKTWIIAILLILLFLGGGIAGTMLVLRKRRYGKLVHERNSMLEEKEAAKALEALESNEEGRKKLQQRQLELEHGVDAIDDLIIDLERKHGRVKLALDDVTSWDDLKVD